MRGRQSLLSIQGTAFQNDQLGGVIIRANNPSQSKTQDTGDTAKRRLRIVQAELRSITGTLVKDETDRLRRMALWREFDALNSGQRRGAIMSALLGLQVRLPDNCRCGSDLATVGDSDGKFAATLACPQCGSSRGAISEFTLSFIQSLAARYGAPGAIAMRSSAIAKACAKQEEYLKRSTPRLASRGST